MSKSSDPCNLTRLSKQCLQITQAILEDAEDEKVVICVIIIISYCCAGLLVVSIGRSHRGGCRLYQCYVLVAAEKGRSQRLRGRNLCIFLQTRGDTWSLYHVAAHGGTGPAIFASAHAWLDLTEAIRTISSVGRVRRSTLAARTTLENSIYSYRFSSWPSLHFRRRPTL